MGLLNSLFGDNSSRDPKALTVHLLDPKRGYVAETWLIGTDVTADFIAQLTTGGYCDGANVYVLGYYEKGEAKRLICEKAKWMLTKAEWNAVEKQAGQLTIKVQAMLDQLDRSLELEKEADSGDAAAQLRLGLMYLEGEGAIVKDYAKCVEWWQKAAAQGYAMAQYGLASMYEKGLGVSQDYVYAHMWANLAATSGDEAAVKKRDAIAMLMTPKQLAEAQRLAREWTPGGK